MDQECTELRNLSKENGNPTFLTDILLVSFPKHTKSLMSQFKSKKNKIPNVKLDKEISLTRKCKLEFSSILTERKIDILLFCLHASNIYKYNSQIIILSPLCICLMNTTNLVELMAQNKYSSINT
jgi:hypothetical protein